MSIAETAPRASLSFVVCVLPVNGETAKNAEEVHAGTLTKKQLWSCRSRTGFSRAACTPEAKSKSAVQLRVGPLPKRTQSYRSRAYSVRSACTPEAKCKSAVQLRVGPLPKRTQCQRSRAGSARTAYLPEAK